MEVIAPQPVLIVQRAMVLYGVTENVVGGKTNVYTQRKYRTHPLLLQNAPTTMNGDLSKTTGGSGTVHGLAERLISDATETDILLEAKKLLSRQKKVVLPLVAVAKRTAWISFLCTKN